MACCSIVLCSLKPCQLNNFSYSQQLHQLPDSILHKDIMGKGKLCLSNGRAESSALRRPPRASFCDECAASIVHRPYGAVPCLRIPLVHPLQVQSSLHAMRVSDTPRHDLGAEKWCKVSTGLSAIWDCQYAAQQG